MTLFQITYQHIQEGRGSQLQPCPFLSVVCDQSCPGPLLCMNFTVMHVCGENQRISLLNGKDPECNFIVSNIPSLRKGHQK